METGLSRARILFGTDEPVPLPVRLSAGPLSVELEDGNLRYARLHGHEMIRAVSFLVRDGNWGTYRPILHDLTVDESPDHFAVSYTGEVRDDGQALSYTARILGRADGSLEFAVEAEPLTDFVTNRAGFVVLHPILGVAGKQVAMEEADGSVSERSFPALIDPAQPFGNLRALTHEFAPGLRVTCRMEGDVFETEDQRNWLDASYKTYVRPLALPWPYVLARGERLRQRIVLAVTSSGPGKPAVRRAEPAPTPALWNGLRMPALGVGLEARDADPTLAAAGLLSEAAPRHVLCFHNPGDQAGSPEADAGLLRQIEAGRMLAGELWLEAVVHSVEDFEREVAHLGELADRGGRPFSTVLLSPQADLKSIPPSQPWPPAPPLAALYRAARAAFPGARIGGGMASTFTELNRKRPPAELIDIATFTTSSIVHAADDRSVMEGLEALPAMMASARNFLGSVPIHVGPSAIGMRLNPYGRDVAPNPECNRIPMARRDPRQRGMFGAAWALGFVAPLAAAGANAVTLGGASGDFGLVEADRDGEACTPVFHVLRGLARLAGRPLAPPPLAPIPGLALLATRSDEGIEAWAANLTPAPLVLNVPQRACLAILEASRFREARGDPLWMDRLVSAPANWLALDAHAVVRVVFPQE